MAYDEGLAQRIRESLIPRDLEEIKMFGGIGFLVSGNMVCGVLHDSLIIRVGPDHYQEALSRPHTREFDFTGRAMTGWVMVNPKGYQEDAILEDWVMSGLTFALSLPPK
jgi:hypothetical protein